MMTIRRKFLWWEWGNLLSVALLPLVLTGHPFWAGAALHFLMDFTFQSGETAMNKASSRRHLLIHSLIVGGWTCGLAGFLRNGLPGLVWSVAMGVLTHYAIDHTNKFGLPAWPQGILVDQALHILVLLVISSL